MNATIYPHSLRQEAENEPKKTSTCAADPDAESSVELKHPRFESAGEFEVFYDDREVYGGY